MSRADSERTFQTVLRLSEDQLWAGFKKAGVFQHSGDIGEGREAGLRDFLRESLPDRFGVAKGEVMDAHGTQSGQTDVLIYDRMNTNPLVIHENGLVLLPAEALLATIEVKSTLSAAELSNSMRGIKRIHELRPWAAPWGFARKDGDGAGDGLPRVLTNLLAFKTDLRIEGWARKELERTFVASTIAGVSPNRLDRIAVLERGLLVPAEALNASPSEEKGVLGLWFFSLVNFLAREVERREPFPWSWYEDQAESNWESLGSTLIENPVLSRATKPERARFRGDAIQISDRL